MNFSRSELRDLVRDTVRETLSSLGADVANPQEMQRDFAALREWREGVTAVRKKAILTIVGTVLTGLGVALWLGIKHWLGK